MSIEPPRTILPETMTFAHHIVAWIDILGQRDALELWDRISPTMSPVEVEKLVRPALLPLDRFRSALLDIEDGFHKRIENEDAITNMLSDKQIEMWKRITKTAINLRFIADAALLTVDLTESDDYFPLYSIYFLINAITSAHMWLLCGGIPTRGGIGVGPCINLGEDVGELYGTAISRAYVGEAKIAKHPRIVVHKSVMQYLSHFRQRPMTEEKRRIIVPLADRVFQYFENDEDGCAIVSYLAPSCREAMGLGNEFNSDLKLAARFIADSIKRFETEGKEKEAGYYRRLREYFKRHGAWDTASLGG